MIALNIAKFMHRRHAELQPADLERIERDATRLMADLSSLIEAARQHTIYVPSELLLQAHDLLMPAERMGVIGGRLIGDRFILSTLHDVTGRGSLAHVTADPAKLARALISLERAGASLAGWIHSHPGSGPWATTPSGIDRAQYADWIRPYSDRLVGLIVVRDGYVRVWGDAVERGTTRVEMLGDGVRKVKEARHVYRLG